MVKTETKDVAIIVAGLTLVGLGAYLGTRKPARVKRGGDSVSAAISFRARGSEPGTYQVGFGVAPATLIAHGTIVSFYSTKEDLDLKPEWQGFGPINVGGNLPQVIKPGKLDVFLFVQTETGELSPDAKGFLDGSHWIDDVYEVQE